MMRWFTLGLLAIVLITSCGQMDEFEKNVTIKNYEWKRTDTVVGAVKIADTTKAYNVYAVVRHTDAYKYNNIWLNVSAEQEGKSIVKSRFDIPLASDVTGWYGVGMNDFWEYRHKLNSTPLYFASTGLVKFVIRHDMRDDPLPNITAIGLRVEPVSP